MSFDLYVLVYKFLKRAELSNFMAENKGMTKQEILALRKGEVVEYTSSLLGKEYRAYLVVSEVDVKRGVVCGELKEEFYGVNNRSIESLVGDAVQVTKRVD